MTGMTDGSCALIWGSLGILAISGVCPGQKSRGNGSPLLSVTLFRTRMMRGIPHWCASLQSFPATAMLLYDGSDTTSATENPRATARPKCSSPAGVSRITTSPGR